MSSHHGRRDRPSQKRKPESKTQDSEWGDWSPWEWNFEEKRFVRKRWNARGECNTQKGTQAPETAPNQPRTAADPAEELAKPRLDIDYATGGDYRLEQGFDNNAPKPETTGAAATGMPQPYTAQFGPYANANVRPAYLSTFSDPNLTTSPMPIPQGYPSSVPTTGFYDPSSISSINYQLNSVSLSGQSNNPQRLESDFRQGSYSNQSFSSPPQIDATDAYDEDQSGQDDLGEQDLSDPDEPNEPDDERADDDERDLQDPVIDQSVHDSSRQMKNISKDNIFSTKDSKIRKDSLYKAFKVHNSTEFKRGRIFKILWSEPFGDAGKKGTSGTEQLYVQEAKFGEKTYTTIRRFIIVRCKKGYCMCVPILTYGKQGTAKSGVKADDHAIIYTTSRPPGPLPNELPLHKVPIRVVPESSRAKLAPESRVNYGKVYTVEHNLKVCFIGKVALGSEQHFFADFNRTFDEEYS